MDTLGIIAGDVTGDVPGKFWHGMLYRRQINLFAGPSSGGKSLIACKAVADQTLQGEFVIWCPEEDPVMLAYRLRAAGADMSKVLIANFHFPSDREALKSAILHYAAKLVVFDTAAKHIDGPMARWDRPLAELDDLMSTLDCSTLVIHHTNKNVVKSASWHAAISGATGGLTGTCRMIHLIGQRPDDANQIVLCPVKDSYFEKSDATAFEFSTEEYDQTTGETIEVSYVTVAEKDLKITNPTALVVIKGDAEKKGPSAERLAEAAEFVTTLLADGAKPVADTNICAAPATTCTEVLHLDDVQCPTCGGATATVQGIRTLAEDADVSWGTLKRCKPHLKIESSRKGAGKGSIPFWRLPVGHPKLVPGAPADLA